MAEIKSMAYLQGFFDYFWKSIPRAKFLRINAQAYEEFRHGPLAVRVRTLKIPC